MTYWVFIGAGNMASSLIGGLIASGKPAEHIAVVDPSQGARDSVINRFGVSASDQLDHVLAKWQKQGPTETVNTIQQLGIVIAVKPHIVQSACEAATQTLASNAATIGSTLFISVAAGVRSSSMQFWLPANSALVRCMPNTPALLGLGATALLANAQCTDTHKTQASELLEAAGSTVWVDQEEQLDAVTALSGSGPAYFFYLIEHMIDTGISLGLTPQTAQKLAIDTAFGAASMARAREFTPDVLRENVTSKGGTTAAALNVFDQQRTPEIIKAAMLAAQQRAVEMGDSLAPDTEN